MQNYIPFQIRLIITSLCCVIACSSPFDEAEKHYAQSGDDLLKIQAVQYLKEYAKYHAGVDRYLVNSSGERVDTVDYSRFENGPEFKTYLEENGYRFVADKPIPDTDTLTAQYIIDNVDLAFKVWQSPWASKLSFDEFCKYILPYRNIDEKLNDWRGRFYNKYYSMILDSVSQPDSVLMVADFLMKQLRRELGYSQVMRQFYIDYMAPEQTEQMHFLECKALAHYGTLVLRACGVASSTILTHWRFSDVSHASIWLPSVGGNSVSSRTSVYDEMQPMGLPKDTMASSRTWEYTFEVNEEYYKLFRNGDVYRGLLLPVTRNDITDHFSITCNYVIELPDSLQHEKALYLMRFSNWDWYPIRYGLISADTVLFEKASIHQLYRLGRFDEESNRVVAFGTPFTIDGNGTTFDFDSRGDTVTMELAYNCDSTDRRLVRTVATRVWSGEGWKELLVKAPQWSLNSATGEYRLSSNVGNDKGFVPVFHLAPITVPAWSFIFDSEHERPIGYKIPSSPDDYNYMDY